MDVSDPDSPNFAQYWSLEQVIDTFKPSDETMKTVYDWLTSSGIDASRIVHTDNKGWLAFDATGAEAESLLRTEFYEHHDSVTGGKMPACDAYHLPAMIREHIDYVTPGIRLMAPIENANQLGKRHGVLKQNSEKRDLLHGSRKVPLSYQRPTQVPDNPATLSTCDESITPACIAALYNIPPTNHSEKPIAENSMGIFESEAEYYAQEDLNLFFKNFTKYIPQGTHPKLAAIDGGLGPTKNVSDAGGEADLDILLAYPIIYPQTITLYDVDDPLYQLNPNITYTFGFNTFLDAIDGSYCTYTAYNETGDSPIDPQYPDPRPGGYKGQLQCGVFKPTNVISFSYGGQEADVPYAYQRRQCNEYLKLGLQGVSFFFASGDAGVGNYPAPYGTDNPETGCLGPKGLLFNPTWPNNCPWVTNVGATKVYPGKTVFEPESAVYDPAGHPYSVNYSSGGGFSNIHATPKYQQAAVDTFFKEHNPPYKGYSVLVNDTDQIPALEKKGIYNRIGRGIPDVAANGDNSAIYNAGEFIRSGGTSASTPIFASVVNRINEERLKAGKKPVGFMNPTLYKNPQVLNDITNGTNPGCLTKGFSAVEGWDPLTGLGTPNFPKLLGLYMSLP
ncbi:hypothetical protein MMC10_000450 [Thelotrema lepadinum]|nr:hypothetical protein [Thelotrema lepadinum]